MRSTAWPPGGWPSTPTPPTQTAPLAATGSSCCAPPSTAPRADRAPAAGRPCRLLRPPWPVTEHRPRAAPRSALPVQIVQLPFDGAGSAAGVARGEQVEQRAAKNREQERALVLTSFGVPPGSGLARGQQFEPVTDGIPAEIRPWAGLAYQRSGIALDPEREQRAVRRRGQR